MAANLPVLPGLGRPRGPADHACPVPRPGRPCEWRELAERATWLHRLWDYSWRNHSRWPGTRGCESVSGRAPTLRSTASYGADGGTDGGSGRGRGEDALAGWSCLHRREILPDRGG